MVQLGIFAGGGNWEEGVVVIVQGEHASLFIYLVPTENWLLMNFLLPIYKYMAAVTV